MAVGDIYRATFRGTHNNSNCWVVQHFMVNDGTLTIPAIAQYLLDHFITNIRVVQSSAFIWRQIYLEPVQPTGPDTYNLNILVAGAEQFNGTVYPPVSILFNFRTGNGGRSHRGRMYMPGFPANWTDISGNITGNGITPLANVTNAFLSQLTFIGGASAKLHWVVWSRKEHDFKIVIIISQSGQLAYQRRRKIGVGI